MRTIILLCLSIIFAGCGPDFQIGHCYAAKSDDPWYPFILQIQIIDIKEGWAKYRDLHSGSESTRNMTLMSYYEPIQCPRASDLQFEIEPQTQLQTRIIPLREHRGWREI